MSPKRIDQLKSVKDEGVTLTGDTDNSIPAYQSGSTRRFIPKNLIADLKSQARVAASTHHDLSDVASLLGNEHLSVVQQGVSKKVVTSALGGGEHVNVKEFGARGMGADDTKTIREAIRQVADYQRTGTGKAVLFFPPGYYIISETLEIEWNNIYLQGAGSNYTNLIFRPKSSGQDVIRFKPKFSSDPKTNYKRLQYTNCGVSGMTIDGGRIQDHRNSGYVLDLGSVSYFLAEDLSLYGWEGCIILGYSTKSLFRNCFLFGLGSKSRCLKTQVLNNKNGIPHAGSTTLYFDNVEMTGKGIGADIEKASVYFRNCTFRGNESYGLNFAKALILLEQCRFDDNGDSAIHQIRVGMKDYGNSNQANLFMSNSFLYGRRNQPGGGPDKPLIDVNYCDLDIRNSPALGGAFSYYLKLPDYSIESDGSDPQVRYNKAKAIKRLTINIDNHSRQRDTRIKDPSGIVTGRFKGTVDRQRNRAVVVDLVAVTKSTKKITIDLDRGGVKSISLQEPSTELVFKTPSPSPTAGQELTLVVLNHAVHPTAKLNLPFDIYPVPAKILQVDHGQVMGARYLYQERIMALSVTKLSGPPPGTIIRPSAGILVKGTSSGEGTFMHQDGLSIYVALKSAQTRFTSSDRINLGGWWYQVQQARGCWMPKT